MDIIVYFVFSENSMELKEYVAFIFIVNPYFKFDLSQIITLN